MNDIKKLIWKELKQEYTHKIIKAIKKNKSKIYIPIPKDYDINSKLCDWLQHDLDYVIYIDRPLFGDDRYEVLIDRRAIW